jgi:hypothetical protein
MKVVQGAPPKTLKSSLRLLVLGGVTCTILTGCGADSGVEEGATVTVYAGAAYCNMAQRHLENEGGRAGSVRVRLRCLPATEKAGTYDLAQIGANARRATEDSTTVAYIGEPEPHANRFSETILEEAGIAQLTGPFMNGAKAMHQVLSAIREADDSQGLREAVDDQVG